MTTQFAAQRYNMVEAQLRVNDVTDPRLLDAMGQVARERFVPAAKRALAYADVSVEVAPGRYLLEPRTFAKMVALADVRASDAVLDVGSATGYSAAVLARLAKSVIALEQDAELVRASYELLPSVGAANAIVTQGALNQGLKAKAPYDVIVVEGAIAGPPEALLAQLAEGGRLVAVIGEGAAAKAELFLREHGRIGRRSGFDAAVPALVGFAKTVGFVF
ncbi:MAG TPA: protein-L-isoaspartate O-methyltransferase [Rhizomicrobium sp.]|nr:protein-L-isoaspartate O-methyltransferase [Rhizomicrobium sp.]